MRVERLARDAGLDDAIEILGVDREDAVHAAGVDRKPAIERIDMSFQRRAGAERHHRRVVPRADLDGVDDVLGGLGEQHRVGRRVGQPGQRMAVLLAHRLGGGDLVPEMRVEVGDERLDGRGRQRAFAAADLAHSGSLGRLSVL